MKNKTLPLIIFSTFFVTVIICMSAIIDSQTLSGNNTSSLPKHHKHTYINPTGDEFPILAWITFCREEDLTKENFLNLKKAGFNISLGPCTSTSFIDKTLVAAENSGVKIMINNPKLKDANTAPEIVQKYRDNSNIMGYYIWDEPKADSFEKWGNICRVVSKYDSIHLPMINLLPYAVPKVLKTSSYESYLQEFINASATPFISFDNYALSNFNGKILVFDSFYDNLETVSKVSKANGVPFWSFCLSAPHGNYPYPTKEFLSFEAFSALAYGAQGISYFTYSIEPTSTVDFWDAPINSKCQPTKIWHLVKDNNKQIQALSKIFLGAQNIGVWHTGKKLPKNTKPLSALPKPYKTIVSEDSGVLVSYLQNNDTHYLMIVNHDILHPQVVLLTADAKLSRIKWNSRENIKSSYKFKLPPGGYAIFTAQ